MLRIQTYAHSHVDNILYTHEPIHGRLCLHTPRGHIAVQEFVHSEVGSEIKNLMIVGNAGDVGKRDAGVNMYTVWWTEQKVND